MNDVSISEIKGSPKDNTFSAQSPLGEIALKSEGAALFNLQRQAIDSLNGLTTFWYEPLSRFLVVPINSRGIGCFSHPTLKIDELTVGASLMSTGLEDRPFTLSIEFREDKNVENPTLAEILKNLGLTEIRPRNSFTYTILEDGTIKKKASSESRSLKEILSSSPDEYKKRVDRGEEIDVDLPVGRTDLDLCAKVISGLINEYERLKQNPPPSPIEEDPVDL